MVTHQLAVRHRSRLFLIAVSPFRTSRMRHMYYYYYRGLTFVDGRREAEEKAEGGWKGGQGSGNGRESVQKRACVGCVGALEVEGCRRG